MRDCCQRTVISVLETDDCKMVGFLFNNELQSGESGRKKRDEWDVRTRVIVEVIALDEIELCVLRSEEYPAHVREQQAFGGAISRDQKVTRVIGEALALSITGLRVVDRIVCKPLQGPQV